MKIKELMNQSNTNVQLVVSLADLFEFAKEIIESVKREDLKADPYYTPKEFAELHKVDKTTIFRWVRKGALKKTKIGGMTFYRESDLRIDKEGGET